MAEIPIQKKQGGKSWLWVLPLLLILALWLLMRGGDDERATTPSTTGTVRPSDVTMVAIAAPVTLSPLIEVRDRHIWR